MDGQSDNRKRLASLLDEVAVHEGMHRTLVEGVEVARISKPVPRAPVVYQPKILIVGQGRKRAYLGGEVYRYDAYNYLVLSVPMPAECETEASPEEPLLLLAINVEPTMLGEMMLEMDEPPPPVGPTPRGISSTPMSEELGGAVIRLLECLKSPARQPHARPPDGPRDRLSRAPRGAGRGPACPGQPGRPLRPHRPGPEVRPRRVREAAQRRGAGEEGRDERRGLPPLLQARDGQLAAPVPQANPARPGEAAHGPRRATTRAPPRGRSGTRARRSSAGSSSGSSA